MCVCVLCQLVSSMYSWGRCDRDRMAVGFTTIYAISAHHH